MGITKTYEVFSIEIFDTEKTYNYGNPLIPKNTVQKSICYGKEWLYNKVEQLSKEFENYDCIISNITSDDIVYLGNISNYKKEEFCNEQNKKTSAA